MRNTFPWCPAGIFLAAISLGFPALAQDAATPSGGTQNAQPILKAPPLPVVPEPSPYQLKLQYTGEAWNNTGGVHTGSTYLQNIDAQLSVDTDRAFGWTGGRFFMEGFYNHGNSLNENYVGSVQDPSVIDTGQLNAVRLYQFYYEQIWGNTNVRVGISDIETEFGVTKPMDIFFNGAFAWTMTLDASGQQGLNGPSTYPNTALGLRVRQKLNDQWSIQGAVLNGMSNKVDSPQSTGMEFSRQNGALAIAEVDYFPIARTKIMAGYWAYTGQFDTQNEFNDDGSLRQVHGSSGAYIGAATRLYTIKGPRGLDGFVNFGIADSRVNLVDRSINAGLTFTGLLDSRPTDKLGFGVGVARAGNPFQLAQLAEELPTFRYETVFELTYRARINDWLTVQPNIQYIIHPAFDPMLRNDFLFGLHFEVGHRFGL